MEDTTIMNEPATCDICDKPLPMINIDGKPTAMGYKMNPISNDEGAACCKECFDQYVTRAHTARANRDAADMMALSHDIIGRNGIPPMRVNRRGRAAAFTKVHGLALMMLDDANWTGKVKDMSDRLFDMLDEFEEMWSTCENIADIMEAAYSADDDPEHIELRDIAEEAGDDLHTIRTKIGDDIIPQMFVLLDAIKHLPMAE